MRLDAFNLGDIIANKGHFDAEAFIALAAEQAAVVPVSDAIKGAKPVAFVVCKPNNTLTEDAVREYSRSHLAVFQHPRSVWFQPSWRSPAPTRSIANAHRTGLRAKQGQPATPRRIR